MFVIEVQNVYANVLINNSFDSERIYLVNLFQLSAGEKHRFIM